MKRPDSHEWIIAKKAGNAGETIVSECFRRLGSEVMQRLGKGPYDLTASASIEVKRDLIFTRTGKVAVEVAYNNMPSGICVGGDTLGFCAWSSSRIRPY